MNVYVRFAETQSASHGDSVFCHWFDDRLDEILTLIIGLNSIIGDARGVMVIVVGNRHGDTSSNSGRDRLHFTKHFTKH